MTIVLALADELRSARTSAHLTQAELARAIGVSRKSIGNWEHGYCEPRSKEYRKVLRFLVAIARAKTVKK